MRNVLNDLATFAIIAEERSFTRAARRLGISQSALSHSMQGLERRLGVELLARNTRSVSPTAAGDIVLDGLAPAMEMIERSLDEVRKRTSRPTGRIRLIIPRVAFQMVLLPKLASFASEYPEVGLDVTTASGPIDIVAGGYDVGVQLGEFVQRDMIAVRVSDPVRLVVFGSPEYLNTHPAPRLPNQLKDHACIGFRFPTGIYRWEFQKGRQIVTVNPQGQFTFDDSELVTEAALKGVGLGMALETTVSPLFAAGRLVEVLGDWCPSFPGYYLYYPSRKNRPAALSALIATLRLPG